MYSDYAAFLLFTTLLGVLITGGGYVPNNRNHQKFFFDAGVGYLSKVNLEFS